MQALPEMTGRGGHRFEKLTPADPAAVIKNAEAIARNAHGTRTVARSRARAGTARGSKVVRRQAGAAAPAR
jgi:hypothetical protein